MQIQTKHSILWPCSVLKITSHYVGGMLCWQWRHFKGSEFTPTKSTLYCICTECRSNVNLSTFKLKHTLFNITVTSLMQIQPGIFVLLPEMSTDSHYLTDEEGDHLSSKFNVLRTSTASNTWACCQTTCTRTDIMDWLTKISFLYINLTEVLYRSCY